MGEVVSLHEVSRFRNYSTKMLFYLREHLFGDQLHELTVEIYYRYKAQSDCPSDAQVSPEPPRPPAS